MSRPHVRLLLTVLMYFGVVVFLYPYIWGTLSAGMLFLIGGACLTVVCGLLRGFCVDGDCTERTSSRPAP